MQKIYRSRTSGTKSDIGHEVGHRARIWMQVLLAVIFISGFVFSAKSARADITTGLVGYWPFDQGSGSTATDYSGNGNNGTLVNSPTWTSGKLNGALQFNGSNSQYVVASGLSNLGVVNQSYTMSAWIKPAVSSETGDILHVSGSSNGTGWCLSMLQIKSGKAFALSWVGGPSTATGATSLVSGQWYNVVHTWDAVNGLRVYVNGVLDGSTAQTTFSASGGSDYLTVGAPNAGSGCSTDSGTGFNGSIDDVRIYNRALSASDVEQLYKYTGMLGQSSAAEMLSTNYGIQSDSINVGGLHSASGSYTMEDTTGEVATGISSSTNYTMSAGYQAMQGAVISVVPPYSVVMSPSIGGLTGGTGNGSTTMIVTTDDAAGYTSTIQAANAPALVNTASTTYTFADYAPGGTPSFNFSISSSASAFGFSVSGTDADQRFKNNGTSCNTGTNSTAQTCWDGLSTGTKTIADRTSDNQPSGTLTTLWFRAQSGASHLQVSGMYVATTTVTVIPL